MTSPRSTGKKVAEPGQEPDLKSATQIPEAEASDLSKRQPLQTECRISTERELVSTSELFWRILNYQYFSLRINT